MDEDIIKELIWEKDRESSIAIGRKTKKDESDQNKNWMNESSDENDGETRRFAMNCVVV